MCRTTSSPGRAAAAGARGLVSEEGQVAFPKQLTETQPLGERGLFVAVNPGFHFGFEK